MPYDWTSHLWFSAISWLARLQCNCSFNQILLIHFRLWRVFIISTFWLQPLLILFSMPRLLVLVFSHQPSAYYCYSFEVSILSFYSFLVYLRHSHLIFPVGPHLPSWVIKWSSDLSYCYLSVLLEQDDIVKIIWYRYRLYRSYLIVVALKLWSALSMIFEIIESKCRTQSIK